MTDWIKTADRMPDEERRRFRSMYDKERFEVLVQIEGAELATVLEYDGHAFIDEEGTPYPVTRWMEMPGVPITVENCPVCRGDDVRVCEENGWQRAKCMKCGFTMKNYGGIVKLWNRLYIAEAKKGGTT